MKDDKDTFPRTSAQGQSKKVLVDEEKVRKLQDALVRAKAKEEKKVKKAQTKSKVAKFFFSLIVIALIGGLGYFAWHFYQESQYLRSPEGIAEQQQKEIDELVAKVSKLIQLPDERPTLATVSNKDDLNSQAFFADVENGDVVLIYANAGRAVIYRESDNRIINAGPIAVTGTTPAGTTTETDSDVKTEDTSTGE